MSNESQVKEQFKTYLRDSNAIKRIDDLRLMCHILPDADAQAAIQAYFDEMNNAVRDTDGGFLDYSFSEMIFGTLDEAGGYVDDPKERLDSLAACRNHISGLFIEGV